MPQCDHLVFETAQGDISFGEEVARSTGRIEECERGDFVLKCFELLDELVVLLFLFDLFKFSFQVVQEQWIDDFVNVLDTRVVHTATAARFGV